MKETARTRKNLRLPSWDYRQPSLYIVTACVHQRAHRFGTVTDEAMHPNDAGYMVATLWEEIPVKFPSISLDAYIVMPNHFHGILGVDLDHGQNPEVTLGAVMQWFKSVTTNHYIRGVKTSGWPRFDSRLWQRNYYETIIRNKAMLETKRTYIEANPANWHRDPEFNADRVTR
ncbi:MAG TPA: transposase [Thermomicrobiales bacterium]|nr:transposase [Thermomicrobiales bacterium]